MLREDPRFYLTNLHSWVNGNAFYGSYRELRFLVKPTVVKAKDSDDLLEGSQVEAWAWAGEYCFEESEILDQKVFPLSQEGREQVIDWLEDVYQRITAKQ